MSRFVLGNCIDVMTRIPDNAIDFILTDPPYLVGFRDRSGRTIAGDKTDEWLQPACNEMYRVLKKDALMVSFYGWNRVDRFMAAWKNAGFSVVGHLVFTKNYTSKAAYLWPQEDDSSEAEHSMTEQKRPVLTLKRKTEGTAPVRSRKTIINVTTPPKWKVKKQKLAEKAAREAELAAKKAQARQALSIYLNLPTLDEAVNTLKPWWPGLFDGDTPRLLACGIRDVLLEDVAQQNIPLSHKKLRRALKAITRSESYLCAMKAGACRYDTEGYVTEHISQEEEAYAAERLDKIRRQNRIKAELQAVLDEK
ncbi:fertility inhibition protein FinO [Escherichia coli]|nr:fertility inhibition protein FinO [Escherichia coli]